ncbi:tetratricopeptide repeat protein [Luminiphilus sp.]|nr:tetratricopeptide repeat-containing sulfotransferase family protein [Luminiphilus sp.]MDA9721885.1 tetratricopeptide repeat protein [Luminiphilus sp.]
MELTVDQALQQGVAAHKEGKLQDAERLYRAILQAQPNHPDANHNLGVLAVAVGKPHEAVPLFKLALEANPQMEQFWLSYIDALIKMERFEDATRVLVEGQRSGVSVDKLDAIKQRLKGGSSGAEPPKDPLNYLLEHYQAGKLEEAEELAKVLTQQFPKHPFGWKVLGVVLKQTGRLAESLSPMQSAVTLSPQDAEAHNNLGNTLKELGRLGESEASYRQAIALKPDFAEAHSNLGNALKELGRLDEAEACFRQAIALKNDIADAHYNLGVMCQELGRLDEAEATYKQAIALKNEYVDAHNNLGNTLKELGRLDEAEASYRQVIALKPDFAEAYSNLGNALTALGRLDEAEACFRQAIALKSDYAEAYNNLGGTLQELGRLRDAETSQRQAIALKPDYAEAHNNLGVTLKELGRFDKAEASLRQAIALKPDFAEAHHNLSSMRRFSSPDEQFRQMQALYRDPASPEKNRCLICFALATAFEDLGDYAAAFQFYAEGNALRKKQLGYEKGKDKKLFERLKASYPRLAGHTFEPTIVATEPAPVFIVGMPRSGTTLVEQIISSHPLVKGAGELPFVSQFGRSLAVDQTPVNGEALATFREQYLNALQKRSKDKAIVTDKMPQNFRFLGLITAALPQAKIIHVKRNPAAVCWANYTKYFANDPLGYCYDVDDILHYHHLYQDLMQYWHQLIPNRIYDLGYELLTEDQEEETRKLIDHLKLEWDDACLFPQDNKRGVATASNMQVRRKIYKGSSEKWKRYKPYLNGALDHL